MTIFWMSFWLGCMLENFSMLAVGLRIRMNIRSGLSRLWMVASIAWIVSSAALLRLDLTVEKVMGWNIPTASSHPSLTIGQLQSLQSMTTRMNLGAGDDLITKLYVIFIPIIVSLIITVGFLWVWAGFKKE